MSVRARASDPATVTILGAGSLGILWAHHLQSGGTPVELITRGDTDGCFQFQGIDGQQTNLLLPVRAAESVTPIEILLVTTKAYHALSALDGIQHHLHPDTLIVLFQNGMGVQQQIAETYADCPVAALVTTQGANRLTRFHIKHAGMGHSWLGPLNEKARGNHALASLCDHFQSCDLPAFYEADIGTRLWQKLCINCGINPFTLLLECPNGDIRDHQLFQNLIGPLTLELARVSSRAGYPASAQQLEESILKVLEMTANNISSMLQDYRYGAATEIENINGYIKRMAEKWGIDTPVNNELYEKVIEKTRA